MKLRAFIFDVYGTLLEVGAAPPDADARWEELWRSMLGEKARLSRLQFSIECSKVIAQRHSTARAKGIAWPEVCWLSVASELVPELDALSEPERQQFVYHQIQTGHTTRLARGAAETLRFIHQQGWLMGIVSNAQCYTLQELREGLATESLGLDLFEPDLCFWSFQHGFSKPDPHVFQIVSSRLESRGLVPADIMMIGDRLDNDIEPARRHGWKTWQLPASGQAGNGNWHQLLEQLIGQIRQAAAAVSSR